MEQQKIAFHIGGFQDRFQPHLRIKIECFPCLQGKHLMVDAKQAFALNHDAYKLSRELRIRQHAAAQKFAFMYRREENKRIF
ncbi:hypothetical protein [Paenibacillus mucilaginosus]|uniref:hypothetical protein n=1 Tax=Paenibacillus mucilaginosus TaxID=61624 RepID=UPI001650F113|nr:hypothetical protein [Paenibacillus mucilaginosus]